MQASYSIIYVEHCSLVACGARGWWTGVPVDWRRALGWDFSRLRTRSSSNCKTRHVNILSINSPFLSVNAKRDVDSPSQADVTASVLLAGAGAGAADLRVSFCYVCVLSIAPVRYGTSYVYSCLLY